MGRCSVCKHGLMSNQLVQQLYGCKHRDMGRRSVCKHGPRSNQLVQQLYGCKHRDLGRRSVCKHGPMSNQLVQQLYDCNHRDMGRRSLCKRDNPKTGEARQMKTGMSFTQKLQTRLKFLYEIHEREICPLSIRMHVKTIIQNCNGLER
ncbi:hypothetical protein AVEN_243489-1 [Araneus ventricosus]|uniref:Uncharacterized protein n=1 Tax=Araneus ventricosus TaxID=182803 RepID=A0A4Y2W7Z8_ARAVE|nr:hypothetical protein AVEN_243489-1 [Araneus ventricosus]